MATDLQNSPTGQLRPDSEPVAIDNVCRFSEELYGPRLALRTGFRRW